MKLQLFLITLISFTFLTMTSANELQINTIAEIEIHSSINPAGLSYFEYVIETANKDNLDLILIKLNTPGGLVSTTKHMLTLIGKSKRPVIIWVTPEGASATSAGAILASGAHLIFMSDGTNLGAATPITQSKDLAKDARNKAVNDLVALVQSLSATRNRNSSAFSKMIKEAKSYKAKEALQIGLIEGIANNQTELLKGLDKKEIIIQGEKRILSVTSNNIEIKKIKMDIGLWLLNIFADPNMAYILFLLGAALLYFEIQAPGGFIAGSVGIIALILSGIGFQVLPVNFGALGLIILSFILFIIEVYVTSYGLITIAGLASMLFGSLFLFRTENGLIDFNVTIVYSAVFGVAIFLALIFFFLVKDLKQAKKRSFFIFKKRTGIIVECMQDGDSYLYKIKVKGEIWKGKDEKQYDIGTEVIVSNSDDLTLKIIDQ